MEKFERDKKKLSAIELQRIQKMRRFLKRTECLETYLRPRNIHCIFLLLFVFVVVYHAVIYNLTRKEEQQKTLNELVKEIQLEMEMRNETSNTKYKRMENSGWYSEELEMGRLPYSLPKPQPRKIIHACGAHGVAATNVVFLMTHQTDAAIFQNILIRHGMKNVLKFLLPSSDLGGSFKYPVFFNRRLTENSVTDWANINLMAHHTRFNPQELRVFMPKNTKYISIVRDPYSLYRSTFVELYDDVYRKIKDTRDLMKWYESAATIYEEYSLNRSYSNSLHFAKNQMIFDLGFESNNKGKMYYQRAISLIQEKFDFIMISNYMEESLIVLAELLCWPITDFAHLAVKENSKQYANDEPIDVKLNEKIRTWNNADAALFDYFNATLWEQVRDMGEEKVEQQRRKLRAEVARLTKKCLKSVDIAVKSSNWNLQEMRTYLPLSSRNDMECLRLVASADVLADELYGRKGGKVYV